MPEVSVMKTGKWL